LTPVLYFDAHPLPIYKYNHRLNFTAITSMGSIGYSPSNPVGVDTSHTIVENPLGHARPLRVVCIGAGASGLDLAYRIGRHLQSVELQIYDKNEILGGTWFENT
jgi:hypothetical protein